MAMPEEEVKRPLWKNALYFASMVGILVFANWGKPDATTGIWAAIYSGKWVVTSFFAIALGIMLVRWFEKAWWKVTLTAVPVAGLAIAFPEQPLIAFSAGTIGLSIFTSTDKGETSEWFSSSWGFAKQIMPLLLFGVLIAGALLGRVGHEGLIPSAWVARAVGGNSLAANFFALFAGAFMYFATLTEVPILQGLIGNGMGKGPALADEHKKYDAGKSTINFVLDAEAAKLLADSQYSQAVHEEQVAVVNLRLAAGEPLK